MTFTAFKEKYQKIPVTEFPNDVPNAPMVSVCVQTYNHAPYIKECLDNILNQKTNFSFEILIGEDGSNDGTRDICIAYAEKYPSKIRLFLHHRENNIQYDGRSTPKFNSVFNLLSARGKYIALCEGDDYWCYENKLQQQFQFMEAQHDVSFCFHGCYNYKQETSAMIPYELPMLLKEDRVDTSLLFKRLGGSYPTAASFFRKELFETLPPYYLSFSVNDSAIILRALESGTVAYIDAPWSVYRTTATNWSSEQNTLHNKEGHYRWSMKGLEAFQKATKGRFKNGVKTAIAHLSYQLVHFYVTLPSPSYFEKVKFISNYVARMGLKNFLKSYYWLIRSRVS